MVHSLLFPEQELARYVGLIAETSKLLGSPGAGFARGLAAFLQSPHFLYLPEVGETNAGRLRLTSHELASRLDVFERDALRTRGRAMVEAGCFPIDGTGRRYPWPLV